MNIIKPEIAVKNMVLMKQTISMSNALESFLGSSIELWKARVAITHKNAVSEAKVFNIPNSSGA